MNRVFLLVMALGGLYWFIHRGTAPQILDEAPASSAAEAPPPKPSSPKPEPRHISHGGEVTLTEYLTPGKWTVFDFYSDGCPPCRALKPRLERLHASRDDLNLVVVDINRPGTRGIDWDSPVVAQYHLRSIPHLVIYDPKGQLVAEDADESHQAWGMANRWMVGY